jgi:predicted thioesterase
MLTAGDSGEAEILVQPSDTAKVLALSREDSFPEVLATSRMIALMELAAARAMRPALRPGGAGREKPGKVSTAAK